MKEIFQFLIICIVFEKFVNQKSASSTVSEEIEEEDFNRLDEFYDSAQPSPVTLRDGPKDFYKGAIRPKEQMSDFLLSNDQLREFERRLIIDLRKGLSRQNHNTSIVKCFITYIQDLPNGQETGTFLAIDLGGTNFRVLMVELNGIEKLKTKTMQFAVPQEIMLGSGHDLFHFLAQCISMFAEKHNIKNTNTVYSMGFTFSFPLLQKSLNKAIIQRWTKGFNCTDVIGKDVVKLLQSALRAIGITNIKIKVVLNDTAGTLISGAWKNSACRIGLIVGTGTNACYMEKQSNAQLFALENKGSGNVLINTEWGAFGDDGSLDFIRNEYDHELDHQTINPGVQLHEKMISGMYMGELVRLILEKAVKNNALFGGKGSIALFTRNRFLTEYVSQIEAQKKCKHDLCMNIFAELGIPHVTPDDCLNVRYICESVSTRAAHLLAAGICALIRKMGEKKIAIGIDGSVYIHHPSVHKLITKKIQELVMPCVEFKLVLSEDGSGRGAALAAAVAVKYERQKMLNYNLDF